MNQIEEFEVIMATAHQPLETAKYWHDIEAERAVDEKRLRNKNALEAFGTFLVGLAIVAVFNVAFHYWLK